jgi:DNA mismatch repair protein MutL
MPRIHQLPVSVITKIAAGEVIERPASVVKELLENSVDAGSTRIDLDVENGGLDLIRVVDNGCGIDPDDLPLAFASHATSKLRSAEDLFRVATLGFRGEALASIGGVAQVTLQSRPAGALHGAALSAHGGELSPVQPWNGAPGTRIEVRHLFFNTPVRRKFLKSPQTEIGHVSETFTRLALAHPQLQLSLRHNDRLVYEVPAETGLFDRIGLFFGNEVRDHLYAIETRQGPATLRGYVADPSCDRGTSRWQYFFVNGRWFRDRSLSHALQEAYRGLLMTGRYAVAFLFLDLPPDLVDVNVHPTKAEVKFRDANAVFHLVRGAVKHRLSQANLTPKLQLPPPTQPGAPPLNDVGSRPAESESWMLSAPTSAAPTLPFADVASASPTSAPKPALIFAGPEAGPFKAIQLHDCYLVVETPEGMLVIDQHALHERILFEEIKVKLRGGPLEKQRLLVPETLELSAEQKARLLEHHEALAELGLEVEDFGGRTILLASYPAILARKAPRETLLGVLDLLSREDRPPSRDQLFDDLVAMMACRAAVKAGDRLSPDEIASLVARKNLVDDGHHCPHGRPTALLFSKHDLERQFRRV